MDLRAKLSTSHVSRTGLPTLCPGAVPCQMCVRWGRLGPSLKKAEVDLFASQRNTHCPLWGCLPPQDNPPLWVDVFEPMPWLRMLLSPFSHHPFLAGESEAGAVKITCGGPGSLIGTMAHKDDSGFGGPALDDSPILRGSVQAGCVDYRLAGPPESASLALAPEKNKLRQAGQSIQVVQTIKVARAGSITAC